MFKRIVYVLAAFMSLSVFALAAGSVLSALWVYLESTQ